MKKEEQNLNEAQTGNSVKADVSGSLPTLEEVANAKQKYADKKSYSGYSTGLDGVKSHWQDGVNWALNYVAKKAQGNDR